MHSPFNLQKPIAIGSDHAGFDYKEDLISFLEGKGFSFKDFGTHSKDSVDYPDFAHPVAEAVEKGEAAFGILLCGTANGVAITANKHQGVRAALCWGEEIAKVVRQHNDANILCLGSRLVGTEVARDCLKTFIMTPFDNSERHLKRLQKLG